MRVVIKIGTSTLTHSTGKINLSRIETLCKVFSDLHNAGHEVIVVSSGAIAVGTNKLRLSERPSDVPTRQAVAAVGQCELMYLYDSIFSKYGNTAAQLLVTAEDLHHKTRKHNLQATLTRLLDLRVIPILNENDSVATAELEGGRIGDNDTLSAEIAAFVKADLLVLLSDIPGLFTADPNKNENAMLIPIVEEITEELLALAGGAGSEFGTGGMATKLSAAQILQPACIDMVITNGKNPEALYEIVEGVPVGTRFIFKK